jgi:NADH-quinone oxidoreductase subunit E
MTPDTVQSENILIQLKEAQRSNGCITESDIVKISQKYGVSTSTVYGVASFYSFLELKPSGRHVIRACRSLPCHLKEVENIHKRLSQILGINPGETTPDGKFSFELTNCIGACDLAPAILIDDDLHGNIDIDNLPHILASYK